MPSISVSNVVRASTASTSGGVFAQEPFGCPQDAVGFGAQQLHVAELLNETANCFVSVVTDCAAAVHEMLSSLERFRSRWSRRSPSLERSRCGDSTAARGAQPDALAAGS